MNASNISSFVQTNLFERNTVTESNDSNSASSVQQTASELNLSRARLGSKPTAGINKPILPSKSGYSLASSAQRFSLAKTRSTPGNVSRFTATSRATAVQERILCTIFESTKDVNSTIGLCILNFSTGELILSEFIDSQIFIRTVHKIQIYEPTEILLPNTSFSPTYSKLATILKLNTPDSVKISEVTSKYFNKQNGQDAISKYSIDEETKKVNLLHVLDKNFALCALSATVYFVKEQIPKSTAKAMEFKSFRIRFENPENTMLIDSRTILGLELIESKIYKRNHLAFYKFLDETVTNDGSSLAQKHILQPLTSKKGLEHRLESVQFLMENSDFLKELRNEMETFEDLDKIFCHLLSVNHVAIEPEFKINYVLLLKSTLHTTKRIATTLQKANPSGMFLKEVGCILLNNKLSEIESAIDEKINKDCSWATSNIDQQNQRCYAVKKGTNGLLDISRQVYRNIVDEIVQNVKQLNDTHELSLDYKYERRRGFYLRLKRKDHSELPFLPSNFVNVILKKEFIECTTLDLLKANARLEEILREILIASEQVIDELLNEIMGNLSALFMMSEAVSLLDLLCCFAKKAMNLEYCLPKFSDIIYIKKGRHPILENLIKSFVPNDIISLQGSSSMQLITGCNRSGKSVYLRQVSLLCIMAQIGCPVPAESATFPIFNKLHARVCSDTMEIGSSNFSSEMKEMAYFLGALDSQTLLILDEVGRGSSIGDGLAISLAITEYLLSANCSVFVSTHFREIPALLRNKPSVSHFHMKTEVTRTASLKMHYKLTTDFEATSGNGIRLVGPLFGKKISETAMTIAKLLEKSGRYQRMAHLQKHKDPDTVAVNELEKDK
ncbi:MutS family protein MSH4 KNAG_0G00950 [Huiozyma naganishii CBS 8797]|uniref:DNA mismatch repair proteins mutS family domain-containing protein n=1 Tax=Huiozyma naganishii (strain ATCC MYA-139 / BCRC 22969 / CBS 8797 / KCTC 17520 / NBRC 10181 / NCYC 3082 / Yp74L-3) TaxID=1071383 RepID=J7S8W9_HUIN7|nr:hypothetical protein KNAG_0G00950 [Kazachstania naganishii CBS 8797]CCK71151.1 hypothetical protein KNAG_0G00950 [Kazachstania naganishii CBS 8797]